MRLEFSHMTAVIRTDTHPRHSEEETIVGMTTPLVVPHRSGLPSSCRALWINIKRKKKKKAQAEDLRGLSQSETFQRSEVSVRRKQPL